jgi:hypothetical protein
MVESIPYPPEDHFGRRRLVSGANRDVGGVWRVAGGLLHPQFQQRLGKITITPMAYYGTQTDTNVRSCRYDLRVVSAECAESRSQKIVDVFGDHGFDA